jgi:hypothetical protein
MGKISVAEVLRLRATSAVSRDQPVRRSAQDDDSVGSSKKNTLNKLALLGRGPGCKWVVGTPAFIRGEERFSAGNANPMP